MINWQPTTLCKCFSQGIFGDHHSGHCLNVREAPELQGDDVSPELPEAVQTVPLLVARSQG